MTYTQLESSVKGGFVCFAVLAIINGFTSTHWYGRLGEFLGYMIGWMMFSLIYDYFRGLWKSRDGN
jgi:hypothetical protein